MAKNLYAWNSIDELTAKIDALRQTSPAPSATPEGKQSSSNSLSEAYAGSANQVSTTTAHPSNTGPFQKHSASAPHVPSNSSAPSTSDSADSTKPNRKHKSLGVLCQRFVQLFLPPDGSFQIVGLDEAALRLSDPADAVGDDGALLPSAKLLKTKVRRLYDVANVLTSLGLIAKAPSRARKPSFQWIGADDNPAISHLRLAPVPKSDQGRQAPNISRSALRATRAPTAPTPFANSCRKSTEKPATQSPSLPVHSPKGAPTTSKRALVAPVEEKGTPVASLAGKRGAKRRKLGLRVGSGKENIQPGLAQQPPVPSVASMPAEVAELWNRFMTGKCTAAELTKAAASVKAAFEARGDGPSKAAMLSTPGFTDTRISASAAAASRPRINRAEAASPALPLSTKVASALLARGSPERGQIPSRRSPGRSAAYRSDADLTGKRAAEDLETSETRDNGARPAAEEGLGATRNPADCASATPVRIMAAQQLSRLSGASGDTTGWYDARKGPEGTSGECDPFHWTSNESIAAYMAQARAAGPKHLAAAEKWLCEIRSWQNTYGHVFTPVTPVTPATQGPRDEDKAPATNEECRSGTALLSSSLKRTH